MSLSSSPGGNSPARIALATKYVCDAIGDSYTFNNTYLTLPEYYPFLLQASLQTLGCSVGMINSGVSGDSTSQMLVRARLLTPAVSGSVAVIYGGTNDINAKSTVQASPSPTTTVFSVAAGKGDYYKANTWALLGGVSVLLASVSTDALTLSVALGAPPPAGTVIQPDTATNLVAIGTQMTSLGYTRQLIGLQHYLNYSANQGDTLAVPESNGVLIRAAQNAAAVSLGVGVADFYTYDRNLIVDGTVTQGSFNWHVADVNAHRNAYGETLLRDCILAAITSVGWLPALRT